MATLAVENGHQKGKCYDEMSLNDVLNLLSGVTSGRACDGESIPWSPSPSMAAQFRCLPFLSKGSILLPHLLSYIMSASTVVVLDEELRVA